MFLVVLIPVLAFVTVLLFAYALVAPAKTTVQGRLRSYGYDLSMRGAGDLERSFDQRVLLPIVRRIAGLALRLTPIGIIDSSRERLRQARDPLGLQAFLFLRLLIALLVPAVYLLPKMGAGETVGTVEILITVFLLYTGYRLPDIWLTFKIDARQDAITRALPDALDLIVVCVEAGYSLEAALVKVGETTEGPLAQEFRQALGEISLGRGRRDALADLSTRTGSADLQTFIAAILQADQMGVSIAEALRVQADAMRVRRRQRAEELIAKAPVKMLIPMAGFIFPAILIVLLGPAAIMIMGMLSQLK